MPDEDKAQKTEPATPKKKEDARKKGQVAQSKELQSVAVLATALLVFASPLGSALIKGVVRVMQGSFSAGANPPGSLEGYHAALIGFVAPVGLLCLPIMFAMAIFSGLVQVVQTGPLFSPEALLPKANRISLGAGMKRMVDLDRLVELVKAIFKVTAVGVVGWVAVRNRLDELIGLASADPREAILVLGEVFFVLVASIIALLGFLAILDVAYQRYRYEQRLKMTKREVRDELRQNEGDPMQRGRFQARYRELSRSRMISEVADADVVVTNPTHFAVALRYDREKMAAPEVIAKGRGHVAARIREVAKENKVTIVENPPLARLLHKTCEVGKAVPENLFQAVAEVLAYVYRIDGARARRMQELRS